VTSLTSVSVNPTQTTTYILTATGTGGTVTQSTTVTVNNPTPTATAPTISSFTVSPASITSGQTTLLSFTTTGNPTPTLSLNNSIGDVSGLTSKIISPTRTTVYTLTATNSAGSATSQVKVSVTNVPTGGHGGGGGGGGSSGVPSTTALGTTVYISRDTDTKKDIIGCSGKSGFSTTNGLSCENNTTTPTSQKATYNFGTVTLKNGSSGEAVKELQRFLNKKLLLSLVIDGKLGPKTVTIIKKWQKDYNLAPDGLVGNKTKAIMNAQI